MLSTIQKSEWVRVLLLAVTTLFIVMASTVYGFLHADANYFYTGLHLLTPADYPVYYSYIEQVKQGHNTFTDLFTSEPQARIIVNPFWLTVGWLARLLHLSAPIAFHLARALLIPAFVIVLYWFVCHVIEQPRERLWTTAFIITTSGIGFFTTPLLLAMHLLPYPPLERIGEYRAPSDMWIGEANTFLTLLHSPHFIFSLTCFLLTIIFIVRAIMLNRARWSVMAGGVMLFWFFFHPFNIPTMAVLLAGWIIFHWIQKRPRAGNVLKHVLIAFIISTPALLYYILLLNFDWLTIVRAYQNTTLTPPLWLLLVGFGVLVPLAVVGWLSMWRVRATINDTQALLLTWLPLHWLAIYLPINFQRRMTLGLHVVTALCAWIGLQWLRDLHHTRVTTRVRYITVTTAAIIGVLLLGFSTLGNWLTEFDIIVKRLPHIYFSKNQYAAYEWLRANVEEREVIVADAEWHGTLIPGFTGRTVYAGHGVETTYYHCCKKPLSEWFFSSHSAPDEKIEFLLKNDIDYVFIDTLRNSQKIVAQLSHTPFIRTVFSNSRYVIVQVIHE